MFQNKVSHIFFICQRFKNMFRIRRWHLIPNGLRREAQSRHSRGLPRGSYSKRDPLFAINLSSLVGVRLDDIALLGSEECRLALASTESQTYDQFMTTDDRWWQHQMPVRALRHDKQTVQLSKSRGLSGSVSLNSETIRKHLLCRLFLSNTASVLVIFQNLC